MKQLRCMLVRNLLTGLLLVQALAARPQSLPSISLLIQQVQTRQQQLDKTRESYTFREVQTLDQLDKHGAVKKEEKREYNVFFVNGHQMQRLVRRDGAALSAEEGTKQSAYIQHKVEAAEQTPPGDPLNPGTR